MSWGNWGFGQGPQSTVFGPDAFNNFMSGTAEKRENVSTIRPEQEGLYNQAINAGMGRGGGGAFGQSADFYRDLLENNNDQENFNTIAAPQMRQYNEEIIPGLSEQFAGMGAGGLSSSGFRNAQIQGGVDLSERLGNIRAQLRQHGDQMRMNAAHGLTGIGQFGLGNFSQNMVTEPGTEGFLSQAAPIAGKVISNYFGGGIGTLGQGGQNVFGGGAVNRPGQNTNA